MCHDFDMIFSCSLQSILTLIFSGSINGFKCDLRHSFLFFFDNYASTEYVLSNYDKIYFGYPIQSITARLIHYAASRVHELRDKKKKKCTEDARRSSFDFFRK